MHDLFTDQGEVRRFALERYLAGELGPDETAAVDAALAASPGARAALEALQKDQEAFAAERPYARFRIEHEQRKEAGREEPVRWPTGRSIFWLALVAGGAAAMVMLAVPFGPAEEAPSDTRTKGAPGVLSFAVADPGAEAQLGQNGMRVHAGQRLVLRYDAGPYDHLAVLGIDGAGSVVVHYPEDGEVLAPLPAGPQGELPFSLVLDDVQGIERFVAVFAYGERTLGPIVEAARAVAEGVPRPLPLAAGLAQSMIWMRKQPPPAPASPNAPPNAPPNAAGAPGSGE